MATTMVPEKTKVSSKPAWQEVERACFEICANGHDRVDRKAAVIYGVKVLGVNSSNKAKVIGFRAEDVGAAAELPYSYTVAAMEDALSRYEGAIVYENHLDFERGADGSRTPKWRSRGIMEAVGKIKNCRVVKDGPVDKQGIFGDLHLLPSHAVSESVLDDAERNLGVYKLSHEGFASEPLLIGGRIAMNKIPKVSGVALVTGNAGTVKGLFESQDDANHTTIGAILSASKAGSAARAVFENFGPAAPAMQSPMQAQPAVSSDQITEDALGQVILAVWKDKTLDKNAKLAKFRLCLGFMDQAKPMPGGAPVDDPSADPNAAAADGADDGKPFDDSGDGADGAPPKKKKKPGDKSPVEEDEMADQISGIALAESMELLESLEIAPTSKMAKGLAAIADPVARKEFAEGIAAELKAGRKAVAESAVPGKPNGPARQPIPVQQGRAAPKPVAENAAAKYTDADLVASMRGVKKLRP